MSEIVSNSIELKSKELEQLAKKEVNLEDKKEQHLEEIEKYSELMHHIEASGLMIKNTFKSTMMIVLGALMIIAGIVMISPLIIVGFVLEFISIVPLFKNVKMEKKLNQYEETCDDKQIAVVAINDVLDQINREKESIIKEIKALKHKTSYAVAKKRVKRTNNKVMA